MQTNYFMKNVLYPVAISFTLKILPDTYVCQYTCVSKYIFFFSTEHFRKWIK